MLLVCRKRPIVTLACEQVVDAMRDTIRNYLGGLPHQFFTVEISAKGEDLAQLMYSMMKTGYVYRNVQYKLDLRTNMLPQGQLTRPACIGQQALLHSCPYPALITTCPCQSGALVAHHPGGCSA